MPFWGKQPVWQKCPLPCIRLVNTGATQFLPYTCYGANCLQEEYDQCLNTANVAPCVYITVILQSGFGDPQYHFYKVTGKQTTSALITDDYGTELPQTHLTRPLLSKENTMDMRWQGNICVVDAQSICYIYEILSERNKERQRKVTKTVYKLTTEQQEGIMGNLWIEILSTWPFDIIHV